MNSLKVLLFTTFLVTLLNGCDTKQTSTPSVGKNNTISPSSTAIEQTITPVVSPTSTTKKVDHLSREEVFTFLKEANQLKDIYSKKQYSINEIYEYFSKYFTNNYVDKVIMNNMKKEGDKWVVANPNSELGKGTYFDTIFNDQTEIDESNGIINIINLVQDGLYPSHKEQIMMLFTDHGWKIDSLMWK